MIVGTQPEWRSDTTFFCNYSINPTGNSWVEWLPTTVPWNPGALLGYSGLP